MRRKLPFSSIVIITVLVNSTTLSAFFPLICVAIIVHSLDMALKCNDFYIVIVSLVVCAIIGGMDEV